MRLFHGSNENNLLQLKPFVSEHKVPVVYLSSNRVVAAFYTVHAVSRPYNWFTYGFNADKIPVYTEYYENALYDGYGGKNGYIYECEVSDKPENLTNINCAFTSAVPIKTNSCEAVRDMYEWFLQREDEHQLIIRRYDSLSEQKKQNIAKQIETEIMQNDLHEKNCDYSEFLADRFADVWNKTK